MDIVFVYVRQPVKMRKFDTSIKKIKKELSLKIYQLYYLVDVHN
jgi:hypothetical protein